MKGIGAERELEAAGLARLYDGARKLREALAGLAESRRTCDAVIETVREPLLVVGPAGLIQAANRVFGETFGVEPRELAGEPLSALPGSLWSSTRLAGVVRAAEAEAETVRDVELEGTCGPDGAPRCLSVNARRLGLGGQARVLLAFEDTTLLHEAGALESLRRRCELDQELVARVSHEFRTPVAAIKGFAETLRRGGIRDRRHRLQFVRTIERHSDWLSRIIEQLLTLYAFESDRREPQPEAIDAEAFLKSFAAGLSPVARKRRVRLKTAVEPGLLLWADRDHLERALQSLCENAVGHAGGRVELRARSEEDRALIEVKDDGPGIPEELLPLLFDGARRSTTAPDGHRGTGLGLRIARCAMDANRGRVWAENDPGGGAVFRCLLPTPRGSS